MQAKTHAFEREATGPLKTVRILDMTSIVFGPYASQMLADLGADVIKLESPGGRLGSGGDVQRWSGRAPEAAPDIGPAFAPLNRNKRSMLLDASDPKQKRLFGELLKTCDVFMVSVRADSLRRLGLDYDSLRQIRPDLIYAHAVGYGSNGPRAGEPAYDDLIQASAGMGDLLGRAGASSVPRLLPGLIADKVCGLFMAQAVLAALLHRTQTGEGQFVEVPMFECVTSFNLADNISGHAFDPPTGAWGYARNSNRDRKLFATKDGFMSFQPVTDRHWSQFFAIAGVEAHGKDSRFATASARAANLNALYEVTVELLSAKTTAEWLELIRPLEIPAARMNTLDELPDDAHLSAVDFFQRFEDPAGGAYVLVRSPIRYSAWPTHTRLRPPHLGEHTDEILAEIDTPE